MSDRPGIRVAHNDPSEGTTHWNGCGDVGTLEHAGCKKRAELPVTLDPGDYAAGFSDGYGRGMTDAARHVIDQIAMAWESGYGEGHAEGYDQGREQGDNDARVVLLDLIAELRACPVLPTTREDLEPLRNMADRAEARLREVQGE